MESNTSSNSNDTLPIGWNDRTNQMSEHDMKLGGIAATKFSTTKGGMTMKNAYSDTTNPSYQTSDQVREFYYSRQQQQQIIETMENDDNNNSSNNSNSYPQQQQQECASTSSVLPLGWEERQKSKQLEQLQHGAFSSSSSSSRHASEINHIKSMNLNNNNNSTITTNDSTTSSSTSNHANSSSSAEIALVKIATHTLETLAETLNRNPTSTIPMKEREEFATAMRHAMEVMAKCR